MDIPARRPCRDPYGARHCVATSQNRLGNLGEPLQPRPRRPNKDGSMDPRRENIPIRQRAVGLKEASQNMTTNEDGSPGRPSGPWEWPITWRRTNSSALWPAWNQHNGQPDIPNPAAADHHHHGEPFFRSK